MQAQRAYTSTEREEIEIELTKDFSEIAGEPIKVKYLNHTVFGKCQSELAALRIYKKFIELGRYELKVFYNKLLEAWIVQIKSSAE